MTEPNLFFGFFDYAIIGALIVVNIVFWKVKLKEAYGCLISTLLFGGILPVLSIGFEIDMVTGGKEVVDNFELLYTYFRFPLYWAIGGLNLLLLQLKTQSKGVEN